jgi:hypothetical protein
MTGILPWYRMEPRFERALARYTDMEPTIIRPSDDRSPTHWKCPDCMMPCTCQEPRLKHERCGGTGD